MVLGMLLTLDRTEIYPKDVSLNVPSRSSRADGQIIPTIGESRQEIHSQPSKGPRNRTSHSPIFRQCTTYGSSPLASDRSVCEMSSVFDMPARRSSNSRVRVLAETSTATST
jgi:hypothetical protein